MCSLFVVLIVISFVDFRRFRQVRICCMDRPVSWWSLARLVTRVPRGMVEARHFWGLKLAFRSR